MFHVFVVKKKIVKKGKKICMKCRVNAFQENIFKCKHTRLCTNSKTLLFQKSPLQ